MTTLFYEPLEEACAGARDKMRAATDFLEPIIERIAMPRRIADGMRRIVAILPRLKAGRVPKGRQGEMFNLATRVAEVVTP